MSAESLYRFPAEWEPHEATWLTWPHNLETWPHNLKEAQSEFEKFARTLAEVENVRILAVGELANELKQVFQNVSSIDVVDVPTNDSWIRDYGPTFVQRRKDNSLIGIDWVYDGWGKKYPPFDADHQVAQILLDQIHVPQVSSKLVIEGGALDSNGLSTLLTTRSCLSRRNPSLNEDEVISELAEKTGMSNVILLNCVDIAGDDTDGHIDQVARFVAEDRIVVSSQQMTLAREQLQSNSFDLIELPDPSRMEYLGRVLPCRYTNFYIANEIVVVPQFDDPEDSQALTILREQFPNRHICPLPSKNLAVGLGSFHCLSQQQPLVLPDKMVTPK